MEKINVSPLIKEQNKWTLETDYGQSLQYVKDKYLNKVLSHDGEELIVTNIKFTPTGMKAGHYVVDCIQEQNALTRFLNL